MCLHSHRVQFSRSNAPRLEALSPQLELLLPAFLTMSDAAGLFVSNVPFPVVLM